MPTSRKLGVTGLILMLFLSLFAATSDMDEISFVDARRTYSAGEGGGAITHGDFNEDGISDLAVTSTYSHQISLVLGRGDGSFELPTTFRVGNYPRAIVSGDFNNDSHLDLASGNGGLGPFTLSILLGEGNGTFQTQTVTIPRLPWAIAAADFDNNGTLDLATADIDDRSVSIFLGHGDGSLVLMGSISVGEGPSWVTTGDFNSDAIMDLAVTNSRSGTLSILMGKGDGTFGPATNYGVGFGCWSVTVSDLNGDTSLDLIVANASRGPRNLVLLLGIGNGYFKEFQSLQVGNTPRYVAVADLNHDEQLDLVVSDNGVGGEVWILHGSEEGSFRFSATNTAGGTQFVVADLDRDSYLDLAFPGARVSVLIGNRLGGFISPPTLPTGQSPIDMIARDFNGDQFMDIAVVNSNSDNVALYFGQGDGRFYPPTKYPTVRFPRQIAVGDFNGDGWDDLVTHSYGTVSILHGKGEGRFQSRIAVSLLSGDVSPLAMAVGDFNEDGLCDIALTISLSPRNPGYVVVYTNRGSGQFQGTHYPVGVEPQVLRASDLNNDGHLDLLISNFRGGGVMAYFGNGNGTFRPRQTLYPGGSSAVVLADINGDGLSDLTIGRQIFLGKGDGTFRLAGTFDSDFSLISLTPGDFNGDHILDVAAFGPNEVAIRLGYGDGRFRLSGRANFGVGRSPRAMVAADFNLDGKMDILATNLLSNDVTILLAK